MSTSFAVAARAVWDEYREQGPGRVSQPTRGAFRSAIATLTDAERHDEDVASLVDLLTRAVERPEGLSFITGEAGLIPRREWHDAVDEALARLEG